MGRLSDDDSDPGGTDDGTTASGLRDYVFGPILESIHNKTENIRDLLQDHLAKTSTINQNIDTLTTELANNDSLASRPSEFTHAMEIEVPADTPEVNPITARFEPEYDGTITQIDIEYPDGTQQAVGVQIRDAGGAKWVPRGGVRSIVGSDPDEIEYVQGNDRTISSEPNVSIDANNPIVAECISSDPVENHLIEITLNIEERVAGDA